MYILFLIEHFDIFCVIFFSKITHDEFLFIRMQKWSFAIHLIIHDVYISIDSITIFFLPELFSVHFWTSFSVLTDTTIKFLFNIAAFQRLNDISFRNCWVVAWMNEWIFTYYTKKSFPLNGLVTDSSFCIEHHNSFVRRWYISMYDMW